MKEILGLLGGLVGMGLIFLGVASIFLSLIGQDLLILAWIYKWGEGPAWAIRIGFVVVGAILMYLSPDDEDEGKSEA